MRVVERLKVRYAETDRMGVAYYSNYFVWFETGRTRFLAEIGIPYRKMEDDYECILPVVEAFCRYRKTVTFDDELEVETRLVDVKRRGVSFGYRIFKGKEIVAEGYTKHLSVDRTGKVKAFPKEIYKRLKKACDEAG